MTNGMPKGETKVLKVGDEIGIPCDVRPGPSSEENLISFETEDGQITGFVRKTELAQRGDNQWYVRAVIQKLKGDVVEVRVTGSFFNTNGLATIRREVALAA